MHTNFADWHRAAGLEPNENSPKHWGVINGYEPTAVEVVALARLFYGFNPDNSSLEGLGTALQSADPSFSMKDHTRLFSVFAGAELVSLIERLREDRITVLAALSFVCGGAQGLRTLVPVPDIPKIAARYLEKRTYERGSGDTEATESDEDDPRLSKLENELSIVGEETNILWWLVSEYSRDRDQRWTSVGLPATSIIAGKELADLTRVIPGPSAAPAFLDRIIRLAANNGQGLEAIEVKTSIGNIPREWREQYVFGPAILEELAPISRAIKLSLVVSDGDEWSPVFEKGTSIASNSTLAPNALAYQVFLERMLARVWKEVE